MNEYIGTFGSGHLTTAIDDKVRAFVVVHADNYAAARQIMFDTYGMNWSHLYDSREAAGVYRFRLVEIPLGE